MHDGTLIKSISARQIDSDRGHPGVETTVVTRNGAVGVAVATAGVSVGIHEVQFVYDGGERWGGRGVQIAVEHIEEIIAPAIMGMDASRQTEVDDAIIALDPTPNKAKLGGNATASVSAAVLKAGAAALGIPLYQHIGGVNAVTLPVPGMICLVGSDRYGGGGSESGGKPSHALMCYGYDTFADASYAAWHIAKTYAGLMHERFGVSARYGHYSVPPGTVSHDRELWDVMTEAIELDGQTGRIGIQVDVAAGTYYERDKDRYVGLFSPGEKTRDELIALYEWMADEYPFVIIEDPLDEVDYEGHAILTAKLPHVETVGDDLYTTNAERLQMGIDVNATDAILLKVNQIGTISEAFNVVRLAQRNGMAVMPCDSRGEGPSIADYSVGLNTGHLREGALGHVGNRFLAIEQELGSRARFAGLQGIKVQR